MVDRQPDRPYMGIPERDDHTRAIVAASGWLEDLAHVVIHDNPVTYVAGSSSGRSIRTYLRHDPGERIEDELDAMASHAEPWNVTSSDVTDQYLAYVHTLPFTEGLGFIAGAPGIIPTIEMTAPSIGAVQIEVHEDRNPARTLARLRKERREDAEGRTAGRLAIMGAALRARDDAELVRIIETIFIGGTVSYRGIRTQLSGGTRISVRLRIDAVTIGDKGLILHDLPETVRSAIAGKSLGGRPLADLAAIRGFEGLRIKQVNRMASDPRGLNVILTDAQGATLDDVEMDEAIEIGRRCRGDG